MILKFIFDLERLIVVALDCVSRSLVGGLALYG
jgi:hypothetical protein